jgi:hypothetical protein
MGESGGNGVAGVGAGAGSVMGGSGGSGVGAGVCALATPVSVIPAMIAKILARDICVLIRLKDWLQRS